MKRIRFILIVSVFVFIILPAKCFSQQTHKPDWKAFRFLIGEWTGEGGGAQGGTAFKMDLDDQVMIRNNWAEYPPANGRPAVSHSDLMIIFPENNSVKAIYFDNEGHVIHYTASFSSDSSNLYLTGDVIPSSPRFRFIYTKISNDKLKATFEIAPPGKPEDFSKYVEGVLKKKS